MKSKKLNHCCGNNSRSTQTVALNSTDADELSQTFKILANATRLKILHALIAEGRVTAGGLANAISMKPQAVSNQLQLMSNLGIVSSQREGLFVHYEISDPCIERLFALGICLAEDSRNRQRSGASRKQHS